MPNNCCPAGRASVEVVDRLVAADLAQYQLGLDDQARRLRETAQRWADLHRFGTLLSPEEPE